MQFNESNVQQPGAGTAPEVVKEIGQSANELTPPELLSLVVKKLNQISMMLITAFNLPASDYDLSDDINSTTT